MPAKFWVDGFGERLKALRLEAELTLDELAQRVGLSVQMLSQLERGVNHPTLAAAVEIARALGVSVLEFLEEEDRIPPKKRKRS